MGVCVRLLTCPARGAMDETQVTEAGSGDMGLLARRPGIGYVRSMGPRL